MKTKVVSLSIEFNLKLKKGEKFQNFRHDLRELKNQIKTEIQYGCRFCTSYDNFKTGQSYDDDIAPRSVVIRENK